MDMTIACSTLCIYMIILQMNDGIYLMLPVPKAQRVMASSTYSTIGHATYKSIHVTLTSSGQYEWHRQ